MAIVFIKVRIFTNLNFFVHYYSCTRLFIKIKNAESLLVNLENFYLSISNRIFNHLYVINAKKQGESVFFV